MTLILSGTDGLSDVDGTAATPALRGTDANTGIFFPAADTIAFAEGGAEVARFDSAGNLGLGATPAASLFNGANFNIGSSSYLQGTTNTYGLIIANNILLNGSTSWRYINSAAGTQYSQQAGVHYWYNTPSGTAGNAATLTQAMTLDNSGNLLVGTTTNLIWNTTNLTGCVIGGNASSGGFSSIQVSRSGDLCLLLNRLASDGQIAAFARQGTQVGNISVTASATTYATSSDYRLKNTIVPMTGALAKVALLNPVTYKWKTDGSDSQGFIAHELQEVVPECVVGEKDAVDAEGKPQYQGIDTSFLVATLTAAIQEQQALITQLQADVAALKGTTP